MANAKRSLVRRSFSQIDLAFWCLHEHLPPLALLALPTLVCTALLAVVIALVVRTWVLPVILNVALYSIVYPTIGLLIVTFAPLPCAVFAWHRAGGRIATPRECFQACRGRFRRLFGLGVRLTLCYLFWFLLFGIPMLYLWPRTCLAPLVALFENERKILVRCRRLLKEESAVYVVATLHTGIFLTLGILIFVPRLLLLANPIQGPWTRFLNDYLWAFEFLFGAIVIAGMSVSWCISLTLLYREIRRVREGEELREKIKALRQKFVTTEPVA